MQHPYQHKNCQSLFGYALKVHLRCHATCQLCGMGGGRQVDFDLWRQLTVEHLIGESQGGYLHQIQETVDRLFLDPQYSSSDRELITREIDNANTVTACSFCNSTTSRDSHSESMEEMLLSSTGKPTAEVIESVQHKLQEVLDWKKTNVRWKLESIREAFERDILPQLAKSES